MPQKRNKDVFGNILDEISFQFQTDNFVIIFPKQKVAVKLATKVTLI